MAVRSKEGRDAMHVVPSQCPLTSETVLELISSHGCGAMGQGGKQRAASTTAEVILRH